MSRKKKNKKQIYVTVLNMKINNKLDQNVIETKTEQKYQKKIIP